MFVWVCVCSRVRVCVCFRVCVFVSEFSFLVLVRMYCYYLCYFDHLWHWYCHHDHYHSLSDRPSLSLLHIHYLPPTLPLSRSNNLILPRTLHIQNTFLFYTVAGLVGEGLSRLFTCTGYEDPSVAKVSKTLANTMGLLLQKTNIIRDYLEDYVDGRAFWPQEVKHLNKSSSIL